MRTGGGAQTLCGPFKPCFGLSGRPQILMCFVFILKSYRVIAVVAHSTPKTGAEWATQRSCSPSGSQTPSLRPGDTLFNSFLEKRSILAPVVRLCPANDGEDLTPTHPCPSPIRDVRTWSWMSGIEHPWSIDGVRDYRAKFSPVWSRWHRWNHSKRLVRRRPWSAGR